VEFVNPKELKPKAAREKVLELQLRIHRLENCLDDIARAAEIAQFTRQYDVTNAFCNDAQELLKDRLVLPEIKQGETKFTLVESSEDGLEKALDIAKQDAGKKLVKKHGNIDSINVEGQQKRA
jgi:uncharacterized protein (DUF1778 family)